MPLSDFMQLTVNGEAVIQIEDYSYHTEAIVDKSMGRTGSTLTLEGEGFVQGDASGPFLTAASAASAALNRSGSIIEVLGLGGAIEARMTPGMFLNFGPHLTVAFLGKPDSPFRRQVKFKATGETAPNLGGGAVEVGYKVDTAVRPDGLKTITRTGQIKGARASALFLGVVLASSLSAYPLTGWIRTYKYDVNAAGDLLSYTIGLVQILNPLPDNGAGSGVDGEATTRTERDEQMRKVTTFSYDFLITGNATAFATIMRPAPPIVILKESFESTYYKEVRVRGSFTWLEGGDGNDLLDWNQTVDAVTDEVPLAIETYPGSPPDYIYKPRSGNVYTQSGRAVGVGRYPKPPDPFLPNYLEKPKFSFKRLNAVEYETTWSYVLVSPGIVEMNSGVLAQFERPKTPDFLK